MTGRTPTSTPDTAQFKVKPPPRRKRRQSAADRLLSILLLTSVVVLILSTLALGVVLWLQLQDTKQWDFQGASGMAVVIPSFAGVVLAALAIRTQVESASVAYKAAETAWLRISDLKERAWMLADAFGGLSDDEVAAEVSRDDATDCREPTDEQLRTQPASVSMQIAAVEREAQEQWKRELAAELSRRTDPDSPETLVDLLAAATPVLMTLQAMLPEDPRFKPVDLHAEQRRLYQAAYRFDKHILFDSEYTSYLYAFAGSTLDSIGGLILRLEDHGLLEIAKIIEALQNPVAHKRVRSWVERVRDRDAQIAAAVASRPRRTGPSRAERFPEDES